MKLWMVILIALGTWEVRAAPTSEISAEPKKVCVLPVREQIMPPLVYVVRRGVKEAMEAKADLLILDMDTPGGRLDSCREIISILKQFKGDTVTYVNKDAFSAGAFIAVATKRIYMAPESVIGAAAPIIMSPGGDGVVNVPDTAERKMISAVRALIRAAAETNGYNLALVEAMIDKKLGFSFTNVVDGKTNVVTLAREGDILTLTSSDAEKEYGSPPKRLLSSGTVASIDDLIKKLGYEGAQRLDIKPTGLEQLGHWLSYINPILLIIAIVGFYIEFKTPGFGVAGIVGIIAALLYFAGGYVAGLSGMEWLLVFVLGAVLLGLELFAFPGTMVLGLTGAVLMLVALLMAFVDKYPGMPTLPSLPQLSLPLKNLAFGVFGAAICIAILARFLPRTSMFKALVSESASGMLTEVELQEQRKVMQGQEGTAVSNLRPGGKAQFGDHIIDVISQGDMLAKGTRVRIIGFSGAEALVEAVKESGA